MLMAVTFLTLLSRFPYLISTLNSCVPNSHFTLNDKICHCNNVGQWSESSCYLIERRQNCKPGQISWQGCNQCICNENGQLSCVDKECTHTSTLDATINQNIRAFSPWCTPFRSYYVNCNICLCPATGKMSDARCANDPSCSLLGQPSPSDMTSKIVCIPKVMYLFPCLHCLCSDDGYFIPHKCVETCQGTKKADSLRCIPRTLYRKDCNICKCPDDTIPDSKLCTQSVCNQTTNTSYLGGLRSKSYKCIPHRFLKPRCSYCDCTKRGTIDENACLELGCVVDFKYDKVRESCSLGETVPICTECLCLRNGQTSEKYCSESCSIESKLNVLENVIRDSVKDDGLIDRAAIKKEAASELCEPGTIYMDEGEICICPENGNTNFNLCTFRETDTKKTHNKNLDKKVTIDLNVSCEPHTFVEFDCNSCFCNKTGRIDPKWCTYDDCEAKRIIQEAHEQNPKIPEPTVNENCSPGSISKVQCNFCICPDSGLIKDLVCTKNDCGSFLATTTNDKFTCEPLAYYEVDCNVCFCPRDGLKNVSKCTKNHCERSFLRTDVCVAGQLFSDECNVCVCPPNGNKSEKACTNYTCADTAPWKKIFQLSESLLGNQVAEDATRNLELCFPGEEFAVGCKLCVCPDMGLRVYASCSPMLCEEDYIEKPTQEYGINRNHPKALKQTRRDHQHMTNLKELREEQEEQEEQNQEDCMIYNITNSGENRACTPGSMYIIKCQQCICPYMGSIMKFCRPLPKDKYCEQAFPNFNYLRSGRRTTKRPPGANSTKPENTITLGHTKSTQDTPVKHTHTKHQCDKVGKIMDECFICECQDDNLLIEEHCFQSDAKKCENTKPSFLKEYNKINLR